MRINFVENYESLSDEEIVARINGGNYELLSVIIERWLLRILYYVKKYCGENDAEDAVQEATIALYSAVKNFDGEKSSFATFASLCIKRSVISTLKSSKRQKDIPDELLSSYDDAVITDSDSPEKIFFDKEDYKALTDNIRLELSGLEFKVLQLYLSGKKYIDIATELQIYEKTVDNALLRIRKKLKDK